MTGVNFNNNPGIFASAAGAANELAKILKKEEDKKSKLAETIKKYHLAHKAVREEIANTISKFTGKKIGSGNKIVDDAMFSLSLGRIYDNQDGEVSLHPELKNELQRYDSESPEAKHAIAHHLSRGSEQQVPPDHELVEKDRDDIALRLIENPNILFG